MTVQKVHDLLGDWVRSWGAIDGTQVELVTVCLLLAALVAVAWVLNFIAKKIIIRAVKAVIRRTETRWDDKLIDRHVFDRLSQLVPGTLFYVSAPLLFPHWEVAESAVERLAMVYLALVTVLTFDAFIGAVGDAYEELDIARTRPIKSYVQVVKIVVYILATIWVISLVIGQSPVVLLSGLGALSAVLLLVFKDSILGLVASVQLSAHDMVRMGDWISMPRYGADGDVIDIALTTIKVRNFDKTITTVPSYALISDSFQNWRGMKDTGGRRIKRAVYIDQNSVRFCTPEELDRYERMHLLADYVKSKRAEVTRYNEDQKLDVTEPVNGRRLTNLGTFRAYARAYLDAHPHIHDDLMVMVRQLAPGDRGVGLEVYCFTNDTAWPVYEAIQADIFDHLLAVVPQFGLRVYQQPSGLDFQRLAS